MQKAKRIKRVSLAEQVVKESKKSIKSKVKKEKKDKTAGEYEGNLNLVTSTGSTWLDLAISGNVLPEGGIPAGIFVELFGPNSSGKTVALMELAGQIQRAGGESTFNDPEGRLDKGFAKQFGFDTTKLVGGKPLEPDTVTEMFATLNKWEPPENNKVHGFFADSLAALSTNLEMDNDEGDKMGMRRGKEFSEGFRKSCRQIKKKNYLFAASNQQRDNAASQGEKFSVPGGKAPGFYASLRLRFFSPEKIKTKKKKVGSKTEDRVLGTKVKVQVYKNSCDVAYREAYLYLINGYGIDDVRANLQFIKDYTTNTTYKIGDVTLSNELDKAISMVEQQGLEKELKKEMISLWRKVEDKFKTETRKSKYE